MILEKAHRGRYMSYPIKTTHAFQLTEDVAFGKNGPFKKVDGDIVIYSYDHLNDSLDLVSLYFWGIAAERHGPCMLKWLQDTEPDKYDKLYDLAREHNQKRLDNHSGEQMSRAEDAWQERRLCE